MKIIVKKTRNGIPVYPSNNQEKSSLRPAY